MKFNVVKIRLRMGNDLGTFFTHCPSIAATLIATIGIGFCFLVNAISYLAVLGALLAMRSSELFPAPPTKREPGQVKAGLRYAWQTPTLRSTLLMMFVIGTFAYEFPVILPLFATRTLYGNATTYSLMTVAMGVGAIGGGLYSAGRGITKPRQLVLVAVLFGISLVFVAGAPDLPVALLLLIIVGGLSVLFISIGNTTLQLTSTPTACELSKKNRLCMFCILSYHLFSTSRHARFLR